MGEKSARGIGKTRELSPGGYLLGVSQDFITIADFSAASGTLRSLKVELASFRALNGILEI